MPSPSTTIDVVGATCSPFDSTLRGGGAFELSTGACCSYSLSYGRCEPPKNPPKPPPPPPPKNPPLGRCGRCLLRNGKRSSRNCACAGDVNAASMATSPAQSTAAKMTSPTSQRENRSLPNMPIAQAPNLAAMDQ